MIKKGFDKDRVDNFWNGKSNSNAWMRGYLEANCSFGIYLNLRTIRKNRYLNIKPSIKIIIKDTDTINYIKNQLQLKTNITKEKQEYKSKKYDTDKLHLQKREDIDKILDLFKDHKFISKNKQGIFDRFKDAYFEILNIGESWKTYDKKLDDYINNYLPIHTGNDKVYQKEWISKIKKYFSDDDLD